MSLLKKPDSIFFAIALSTALFLVIPVVRGGKDGVFYTIDPDVVYVGNALTYISSSQIHYIDHPGTPAITVLATSYWPFRVYAKLVTRQPFIDWAYSNFETLFIYSRLVHTSIFTAAILIFLKAVYNLTSKFPPSVFAVIYLLSFGPFLNFASVIAPETLSFFFISLWLYVFSHYLKQPRAVFIILLSFISGLAVINKLSNFFMAVSSFILLFPKPKLTKSPGIFLSICIGMLVGLWPIRSQLNSLISWSTRLAMGTQIHGQGKQTLFDARSYFDSLQSLFQSEPWIAIFLLIMIFNTFLIRKRITPSLIMLIIINLVGIIVFSKFPLSYYQLTLVISLVFAGSYVLTLSSRLFKSLAVAAALAGAIVNLHKHYSQTSSLVSDSANLAKYISNHPAKVGTLWEWGRNRDFALLWTKTWAGGIFNVQLANQKPILEDFRLESPQDVFSKCWDRLYIQQVSMPIFLNKYQKSNSFSYHLVPGAPSMIVVESTHCFTKP